jgi:serine/threonine protein kinase/Flp pilus assembly protein TadD
MIDKKWQKVRKIFDSALRHKPDERRRFVNEVCGDDKTLLAEVESLLSSHDGAESFMETPAVAKVAAVINAETKHLQRGQNLGHYEIIEQIGAGGMGEVYLAEDTRLERRIALKILPEKLATDRERMQRFVREAKSASALNHPNIITIYEIGETDNTHFIATEYIEGDTLRELLSGAPAKLKSALEISIQVASALDAAHRAGIVHRDVKPENVMIRPDGVVKLLDFGIAKLTEKQSNLDFDSEAATAIKAQTSPGMIIGTAAYMSPEQALGKTVDARSDIFSFGVMLYEMLASKPPFEGGNAIETIGSILNKEPVPLSRHMPDVPHEIERIINKALRKDLEERYQTAKDLLIDLKDVKQDLEFQDKLERTASPTREETNSQVFNATTSAVATHTTSSAQYIVNSIKHHKRLAFLGLVPLMIAAIALFFFLNRSPVLTEKDTILLADFVNTTGDAVFDLTLKQALAVQLGQTPFLNIYPEDRIQETLRLMNRKPDERITKDVAREICERNGIKAMLLGSIATLGNNYVITLEALNPRTGEALAREQIEAAGKEQVLGKLGNAAKKLREKLGESLQTIEKFDAPVEQATTSSLEALKAYSLGQQQRMAGKLNEAIPFHKRAIALDPNFASAHNSLGEAYFFTEQRDRAAESFSKAFDLRERVSEREKFNISANYYTHVLGDLDKSVETLELWKQTYPREWQPRDFLAHLYNSVGQHENAVKEAQEAIRLFPQASAYFPLAIAFEKLNRFEEANTTLDDILAGGQDSIYVRLQIYRIAFVQGDRARMQQQIDWARGKPYEERMHYEEGRMAMFNGQVRRAEESFRRRIQLAEERGAKDAMSLTHAEFAFWNSFFGDCKETKKSIAHALATLRGEEALNLSGIALAVCGESGQAQSIADEIAKLKFKDVSSIPFLPEMRAAVEISRNNPAKAVEILESTRILERGFGVPGRSTYLRGIAYLRQNAGTEAMNEFQKILGRRGWFDTSPFFPLAHLGLARAAAIAGDTTKSRQAYQDFFALWKDADADIPILIQAKQEYEKLAEG